MKQLFILNAVLILFLNGCKKDDNILLMPEYWEGPQEYGSAQCIRNGVFWEASAFCIYSPGDSTLFELRSGTLDADTVQLEDFSVFRIPLKIGTYKINRDEVNQNSLHPGLGCIFWIGYYDEIDARWAVAKNKESYVTVDSYDSTTTVVRGRFDVYFVKEDGLNYPRNVSFEGGTFEAKLDF